MRITERVDAVKLISRSDAWTVGLPINYAGFHADRLSHLFAVRKGMTDLKAAIIFNGTEGFRTYAQHWLYQYRGVPQKFFHLCLGEISFPFKFRNEDLFPMIIKLLQQTTRSDVTKI